MRQGVIWGLFLMIMLSCGQSVVQITTNGVVVAVEESAEKIRLEVFSDEVIRVSVAKAGHDFSTDTSLMVLAQPAGDASWDVKENEEEIILSTSKIQAQVNRSTGAVSFKDASGKVILKNEEEGGRYYGTQIDDQLPESAMMQVFESPADEAFYGLGQHQNGELNYKGLDVELQQNNIVAVVPFLYSNKNYGILWDNYSITRFGDPRTYEPVSSLKLYDVEGNEGGLTALYYDRGDHLYTTGIENTIDYTTLEKQDNYPEGFAMDHNSTIVWDGFVEANQAGTHKFKLWAAGYYKVWVDGELLFDRWRQCWNPWFVKFNIDMEPGVKHQLKIEWKPDADVSYIGLSYLDGSYADKQEKLSLSSEDGKQIDYYFIYGSNADEVISGYRELTGKAPIVPAWALGLWQSRERYKTQDELLDVVREYRRREIPLDNIVLDWNYWPQDKWGDHDFDLNRFPDAEAMIDQVHDMNARIMISVWPKFYVGTDNYEWFEKNGWLFTKNVELGNRDWIGEGYLSTFYDSYHPEARKAFWKGLNEKLFSKGIDAWWLDATEPDIHSNVSMREKQETMTPNHLGSGREFFNAYSLLQAKGVYEGQRNTNPDKRVFILTRSMYGGQQHYGAATWSGDVVSRWSDLRDQWAAGINVGLSGIPYWTTDIGGFAVEKRYENPTAADLEEWRELNTRWFQFGAFTPLLRIHGQFPYREIWNIAPEGSIEYESMVDYTQLRYRLMPYIYSLAAKAYHDNSTMMRGLVMDFAADERVNNIADQYLFGPSFMVCPVGEFRQRQREVYLPEGSAWYNFYSYTYYEGGQNIAADAPLERMPLYVKAGSIVPFGPNIQYTSAPNDGTLKLMVYTGADASFSLYEDEGINYDYEQGEFSLIAITYDEAAGSLTLAERQGAFDGMKTERKIEVYFITPDGTKGLDLDSQPAKTIIYDGSEITLSALR